MELLDLFVSFVGPDLPAVNWGAKTRGTFLSVTRSEVE
jgi:hypothetical protein